MLRPAWGHLGVSWAILGATWGGLGPTWGRYGGGLGAQSGVPVEAKRSFSHLGVMIGSLGLSVGIFVHLRRLR